MPAPISRRGLAGAMPAGAALFLPMPARAQAARPRIVVAVQSVPATLEPLREVSNRNFRIGYNVFDTLIGVDYAGDLKLVPALAERWERRSPSVLELTLREGVRFHNGDLLTAEDVAFTFGPERASSEKAPGWAQSRAFIGSFERVEAIDARTVRVTTKTSDPLIEKRLAEWGSQIVSRRGWMEAGSFEAWEQKPVGTGPYSVKEVRRDERVVLAAHDAHFRGAPAAGEIVFRVVPEVAGRLNGLQTGEIDIATEVTVDQLKQIQAMPGREVVGGPVLNIRVLVYDKAHPQLADPRVRRALSLAIDRQAIVETLFAGRTRVPRGHQHESYGPLFHADYKAPGHDPDAARRLLREAGYAGGAIPYRVLNNYYTQQVATAQVLIEMWRAVGLNVQMQMVENPSQLVAPKDRGIRDWSNTVFWLDPSGVLTRLYGPRGTAQLVTKEWSNGEFNRLAEVLDGSVDAADRRAAFGRMLEIYDQVDPPGTVLHDLVMFYGKKASLRWSPYPVEYMDFGPRNLSIGA